MLLATTVSRGLAARGGLWEGVVLAQPLGLLGWGSRGTSLPGFSPTCWGESWKQFRGCVEATWSPATEYPRLGGSRRMGWGFTDLMDQGCVPVITASHSACGSSQIRVGLDLSLGRFCCWLRAFLKAGYPYVIPGSSRTL